MNYEIICRETQSAAKRAGHYIAGQLTAFSEGDVESKGTHDLVSFVDKTAEEMIVADLKKILPEAGFITEEGTEQDSDKELVWIIDPLDGTTNFVNGIYPHSVSIALRRKEETLVGVVYEIGRSECFSAYKGGKAQLNGKPIEVNSKNRLDDALIATGFPYNDFSRQAPYVETLGYFMRNTRGIRRFGSAAVDLCYFACGRFDAFYEYSLKPWDVAAGAFIAQKAGGVVSDFSGGDNYLFGQEIVAANAELFDSFLYQIRSRFYA